MPYNVEDSLNQEIFLAMIINIKQNKFIARNTAIKVRLVHTEQDDHSPLLALTKEELTKIRDEVNYLLSCF